ncbi:restriction endonuclease subunit S [Corynebacterium sp. UMB10321]|uniref:restriction endonuclease subunit S n=1 Tax=Corynebacterium sp. UMB10321 TaxID=3046312 RepID=UPI00254E0A13|nr:restriction endonuclease subunit S [Corynebacterium sp. UMB10321]MDK8244761.1 restriction endonuclease subunit S [Corynebacterium sp. UMB10321]
MTWTETTLGELVTLQRGFDLPSKSRIPGSVPVLSAGKKIASHNQAKVTGPGFVIGRSSNLGIPKWSDTDFWPLNTTLFAKDFKGNNPRWLFYLFQTIDLTGFNSGTAQASLNRNYISGFSVTAPSRSEQDRIVGVLGSLDDKTAANTKVISASRKMIQTVAETVSNTVSLDELAVRNKKSINPAKLDDPFVMHYSIPSFDSGAPMMEPTDSIKSNKMHVERAAVLVSKLNPDTPRVWSVPAPATEALSLASTEFIVLEPSEITQSQLYAATLHPQFHRQLASLVGGTSKSHQRVKPEDMLNCIVPDVRVFTDAQIELLETLAKIEVRLTYENLSLAKTRDELLPLLMNGKITVREAAQEATAAGAEILGEENEA